MLAKTLAQLIVGKGFEKSGGSVGLLNYDIPEYNRAYDRYIKPILAAAGINVVRYTIPPPASTADIGNSVSVVQSAQLKMAAQGVKTVTFLCSGCAAFFIQSANSQNYYPRYVLSSMDTPGAADGATYERALRSSVSIGWQPSADYGDTLPRPPRPTARPTSAATTSRRRAGSSRASQAQVEIAILTCEAVLQFYEAAKANPTASSPRPRSATGCSTRHQPPVGDGLRHEPHAVQARRRGAVPPHDVERHLLVPRLQRPDADLPRTLTLVDRPATFPLGPFTPYEGNPVLRPQGSTWESANLYNPAATVVDDRVVLL